MNIPTIAIVLIVLGIFLVLIGCSYGIWRQKKLAETRIQPADCAEHQKDFDKLKQALQEACKELNVGFTATESLSDVKVEDYEPPPDPAVPPGHYNAPPESAEPERSARVGPKPLLRMGGFRGHPSDGKFKAFTLVYGLAAYAAQGLISFLCVEDSDIYGELSKGVQAMEEEVAKNGTDEDKECLHYVLYEEAGSNDLEFQHGWKRDCDRTTGDVLPERQVNDPNAPGGKRGMTIDDFVNSEVAKSCKLTKAEVAAARFYTTAGYKSINNPLRDVDRRKKEEAHPLPVMVWLLASAIKKMRKKAADSPSALEKVDLFRGMSNVELQKDFMTHGGTENAPMSTTKDVKIALHYSMQGEISVLLRIRSTGFMNLGADLMWLSAFPFEQELLYPPLTFLKPKRSKVWEFKIGSATFHVVDVEPQMS